MVAWSVTVVHMSSQSGKTNRMVWFLVRDWNAATSFNNFGDLMPYQRHTSQECVGPTYLGPQQASLQLVALFGTTFSIIVDTHKHTHTHTLDIRYEMVQVELAMQASTRSIFWVVNGCFQGMDLGTLIFNPNVRSTSTYQETSCAHDRHLLVAALYIGG